MSIKPKDVRFSSKTILKKDLNRNIWDKNDKMNSDVKRALLKISKLFWEYLGISEKPLDVVVRGSIANYNWTANSDIDLHLIFDFKKINKDVDFVRNFLDSKRFFWNMSHNISVKGFDVELYSENEGDENSSLSTYSLYKNDWIKEPKKTEKLEIDEDEVKTKASGLINSIEALYKIKKDDVRHKAAKKLQGKIKKMRQAGLSKDGEFSSENLAFKVLRKTGYLDKLWNIIEKSLDKSLTLNEASVSKSQQRLFGMVSAYQNGTLDLKKLPSELQSKVKSMAGSISKKSVSDFASTKLSGLPEKIEEDDDKSSRLEYGCLMLYFDVPWWNDLMDMVDDKDLYAKEGFGKEREPHVTLLYGFHDDEIDKGKLEKFVDKIIQRPISIQLDKIDTFNNDEFDVLKFNVSGDILHKINKALTDNFEYTSDFPDYNPHMTIAYLLPKMGVKYLDLVDTPIKMVAKKVVYSTPNNDKTEWVFSRKNTVAFDKSLNFDDEKKQIVRDFVSFTCNKLKMQEPVTVVLKNGRDEYISTTAAYAPRENENHIRAGGRALVDILRSIGHELVHNRQRELDMFRIGEAVQNIGGAIEDQANSVAGVLIKDFASNYNYDKIYDF